MSEYEPPKYALGQVCEHDGLARKCDICALTHELEWAKGEIERLEQTVQVLAGTKPERRVWFHGEHPATCMEPNERSPEDQLLDEFAAMGDSQGGPK